MATICRNGQTVTSVCIDGNKYACDTTGADSVCRAGISYLECGCPALNAPSIAASFTFAEGASGTINAAASGGEGTLSYSLSGNPSWITIDSATGVITYNAPQVAADTGFGPITVTVTDQCATGAQTKTADFSVTVTDQPSAYSFVSSTPGSVKDYRSGPDDANAQITVGNMSAFGWGGGLNADPCAMTGGIDTSVTTNGTPDVIWSATANPVGSYITNVNTPAAVAEVAIIINSSSDPVAGANNFNNAFAYITNSSGTTQPYTSGTFIDPSTIKGITAGVSVASAAAGPAPGTFRTMQVTVQFKFIDNSILQFATSLNARTNDGSAPP